MAGTVAAVAGCIVGGGHAGPHPLYPGERLPAANVATLYGPIATVDGRDVAGSSASFGAYELLPGCHVVKLLRSFGASSSVEAWSVSLPELVYAIRMRAAYAYRIDFEHNDTSSPTSKGALVATEQDPGGATRAFGPATSAETIEACRRWGHDAAGP
jgi:hypothetical protein